MMFLISSSCDQRKPSRQNELISTALIADTTIYSKESLKTLSEQLDSIYDLDQESRVQAMAMISKHGIKSKELRKLGEIMSANDAASLVKVKVILDRFGWLGSDVIGKKANSALFLVIQHADEQTRLLYLPMMRDAVKSKRAKPADLALLEDRTALEQGKKQLYGSQLGFDEKTKSYYLLPLEDPDSVDAKRRLMGLPDMNLHLSQWGIEWKAERIRQGGSNTTD